jgi:hypothetical protein
MEASLQLRLNGAAVLVHVDEERQRECRDEEQGHDAGGHDQELSHNASHQVLDSTGFARGNSGYSFRQFRQQHFALGIAYDQPKAEFTGDFIRDVTVIDLCALGFAGNWQKF